MERPNEGKDFVVSLEHRIEHLTKRKDRCEAYSTMDQSKLDEAQLKAAQNLDEVVGMIKEAKHTEAAYRTYMARKEVELKQRLQAEFLRGKAEAAEEARLVHSDGFAQVSTFLSFAAAQYERGGAGNVRNGLARADITALLSVLHEFYLGGATGASAMHKLVDGSSEIVGSSGVSYGRLQLLIQRPIDESEDLSSDNFESYDDEFEPDSDSSGRGLMNGTAHSSDDDSDEGSDGSSDGSDVSSDVSSDGSDEVSDDGSDDRSDDASDDATRGRSHSRGRSPPRGRTQFPTQHEPSNANSSSITSSNTSSNLNTSSNANTYSNTSSNLNTSSNANTFSNTSSTANTALDAPNTSKPSNNTPEPGQRSYAMQAGIYTPPATGSASPSVLSTAPATAYPYSFSGNSPISYAKMAEQGRTPKSEPVSASPSPASTNPASANPVSTNAAGSSAPKQAKPSTPYPTASRLPEPPKRTSKSPPAQTPSPPANDSDSGFQLVRNDRNKKYRFKGRKPTNSKQ